MNYDIAKELKVKYNCTMDNCFTNSNKLILNNEVDLIVFGLLHYKPGKALWMHVWNRISDDIIDSTCCMNADYNYDNYQYHVSKSYSLKKYNKTINKLGSIKEVLYYNRAIMIDNADSVRLSYNGFISNNLHDIGFDY
jgi:hypothetical protein